MSLGQLEAFVRYGVLSSMPNEFQNFLKVLDSQGNLSIHLLGGLPPFIPDPPPPDKSVIKIDGTSGDARLGGNGKDGDLGLYRSGVKEQFKKDYASIYLNGKDATMTLRAFSRGNSIFLDGYAGNITLHDSYGDDLIFLDGYAGNIIIKDKSVPGFQGYRRPAYPVFGLNSDGKWYADEILRSVAWFAVGKSRNDKPKDDGKAGMVFVRDRDGHDSMILDGLNGNLSINDENTKRTFSYLSNALIVEGDEKKRVAGLWIGRDKNVINIPDTTNKNKPGVIGLFDKNGDQSIFLDGSKGDIILTNADCAEEFDVLDSTEVEPGTVVIVDEKGNLRMSTEAYDNRVVGVISGAGDYKPGIVLDKKHDLNSNRKQVSLIGKVFCKVDAEYSPVKVGDMLTTSPTPGYAMKATKRSRSFGAVIGKALAKIQKGRAMIPILIGLQ